jgi:peptidoglycan DL-endopeptidase CwlO
MKNRIGTKIGGVICIFLIFFIIQGVISSYSLKQSESAINKLSDTYMALQENNNELTQRRETCRFYTSQIAYRDDETAVNTIASSGVIENSKKIEQCLAIMEDLCNQTHDDELVAQFETYKKNILELDDNTKKQADAEYNNLNTLLSQTQTQLDTTADNITEAEQLALQYEQELENQRIEQERAEAEQARREAEAKAAAEQSSANTGISYDVTSSGSGSPLAHSDSDLAMLAAIIECEAGNQPYIGKLAVGSVVINRVNSSRFPNSISAVLYASGQFTPVASGRFAIVLARGASDSCVQAAQEVLNGNIVIDALFFHVYRSGTDNYGTVIGDHIFY